MTAGSFSSAQEDSIRRRGEKQEAGARGIRCVLRAGTGGGCDGEPPWRHAKKSKGVVRRQAAAGGHPAGYRERAGRVRGDSLRKHSRGLYTEQGHGSPTGGRERGRKPARGG